MQPWQTIDRAVSPDGTELVLVRRGDEWVVRAAGQVLMSSRVHGSEETLRAFRDGANMVGPGNPDIVDKQIADLTSKLTSVRSDMRRRSKWRGPSMGASGFAA